MWPSPLPAAACLAVLLLTLATMPQQVLAASKYCANAQDPVRVRGLIHRQHITSGDEVGSDEPDTIVLLRLERPLCVMLPDDVTMALRPQRLHELALRSEARLPASSDTPRLLEGTVMLNDDGPPQWPVWLDVTRVAAKRKRVEASP